MRLYKAIKPVVAALGGDVSKIAGKPLSKIATYLAPFVTDFINKDKEFEVTYVCRMEEIEGDETPVFVSVDKTKKEILEVIEKQQKIRLTLKMIDENGETVSVETKKVVKVGFYGEQDPTKEGAYVITYVVQDDIVVDSSHKTNECVDFFVHERTYNGLINLFFNSAVIPIS